MQHICHQGDWISTDQAMISVQDRAWLYGLSFFETLLSIDGKPQHLEAHIARLQQSAKKWLSIEQLPSISQIGEMIDQLLTLHHLKTGSARIRITLSSGAGVINDLQCHSPSLTYQAVEYTPPHLPARLTLSPWRKDSQNPFNHDKIGNYAISAITLQHAKQKGFDDAIWLNELNQVAETACCNIFIVMPNEILTPSIESGCLPGTMRSRVIQIAKKLNINLFEKEIDIHEIFDADALFITNALCGVRAVESVNDQYFNIHHPWMHALQQQLRA